MGDRLHRATGTVRFRVTAAAVLVVLAVLVSTGVGLALAQRRLLVENIDETIRAHAERITRLVETDRLPATLTDLGDEDTLAQVVASTGEVLAATPPVAGATPLVAGRPPGSDTIRTVDHLALRGQDRGAHRLLTRRLTSHGRTTTIYVALGLDDVHDSTATLAAALTAAVPIATALLAVLVWNLVGRVLRPVEAIRAEVAGVSGDALHRRVPQPPGRDEISRLARTMNAMLERIERSAEQQRQFVGDASHELRAPLTRIRTTLEVDATYPHSADVTATHRAVLAQTIALQHLVDDLLLLAGNDAEEATGRREPVDLDDLVLAEAGRLRAEYPDLTIDVRGVSAAQVLGDPEQLARAIGNLTANAVRYADTRVTLAVAERDEAALLTVADDGPGIPPEAHRLVFERFRRLDAARRPHAGGAGLGLAITRDIVTRHGGTIAVDPAHHPGARIIVALPRTR